MLTYMFTCSMALDIMLRAFGKGLVFPIRLYSRKKIKSVNSVK